MAKNTPKLLIKESGKVLKDVMRTELALIADNMVGQIMARARRLIPSQRLNAIQEIDWPGEQRYRYNLLEALSEISSDAIAGARKELPKAKSIKLVECLDTRKFSTTLLDDLPPDLQKKLQKQSQLLVDTQLQDLQKNLFFQYTDSYDTTDDMGLLQHDLEQTAMEFIDGTSVSAGSDLLAAKVVNDARNAFFFDKDVLEQVDAFVFTNGDPVTPICQDLNGTVFAKDDPNMFRYTPPLHWNCKSYIEPIPAGQLGDREIEMLKPSTKSLEDSIQFSEAYLSAVNKIHSH